jgi:hypothetical protein
VLARSSDIEPPKSFVGKAEVTLTASGLLDGASHSPLASAFHTLLSVKPPVRV